MCTQSQRQILENLLSVSPTSMPWQGLAADIFVELLIFFR